MRLPNFLVIGAAKSGTTAVYDYLGAHPDVYMSPLKETNFLALEGQPLNFTGPGDERYVNCWSLTTFADYCAQFRGATTETAVGEASPLYLYDPQRRVIGRIRRYLAFPRLVVVLRHPVERAYSAFLHAVRDGREPLHDFGQALAAEDSRVAEGWEHLWHYRRMGYYGHQLRRYVEAFGRGRVRAYLYEDLQCAPVQVLQDCYRFLGVDGSFVPDMSVRPNSTSELGDRRPPLLAETRANLLGLYREDIRLLQRLLGRDLSHWLEATGAVARVAEAGT